MVLFLFVFLAVILWIVFKVRKWTEFFNKRSENLKLEIECRQRRDKKVYNFEKFEGTEKQALAQQILTSNISELLIGQFSGKFTSKQIVTVFAERSYRIGRQLNLTADECFEEALKIAEEKDFELQKCIEESKSNSKTEFLLEKFGLLHGIPFSVKDFVSLKGYLNTNGVGSRADFVDDRDCDYVTLLKVNGAIPIVKGNVPILSLTLHTENRIWGCAENPWNRERSCGGSSGGEAGLLAANCTQFGIGTDLGGSLRVPASFCGVYSFMPTAKRHTCNGIYSYFLQKDMEIRPMSNVIGPMTKNLDDLTYLMKIFYSEKLFDMQPNLPRIVFNSELYNDTLNSKRLKIGIIKEHETVSGICPAVLRALNEVEEVLTKLGHEVIEIDLPNIEDHCNNHIKLLTNQVCEFLLRNWREKGDDLGVLNPLILSFDSPTFIPKTLAKIAKLFKQHRLSQTIGRTAQVDNDGFTEIVQHRDVHLEEINKIWTQNQLDSLIVAPIAFPSFKSKDADDIGFLGILARLAIYWQFPSGTMPITVVKEEEDTFQEKVYDDMMTSCIRNSTKGSQGMPIGLEIIAAPHKDEKALAIMKIIEQQTYFHVKHPYPEYD